MSRDTPSRPQTIVDEESDEEDDSCDEALAYYRNWLASHERPASPESIVNKFLINEGKTLTKE